MPIKFSGPFFDGTVDRSINAMLIESTDAIGREGVNRVKTTLHGVLQHPTGNYESHIHTDRQQNDLSINDTNVIYGPWLEGVSSRNQSSRFKGYGTFRKVYQTLDKDAAQIIRPTIAKYVERMT